MPGRRMGWGGGAGTGGVASDPQGRQAAGVTGGATLCVIDTWVSIGAIVLVQLNYAIAPRWWRRKSAVALLKS